LADKSYPFIANQSTKYTFAVGFSGTNFNKNITKNKLLALFNQILSESYFLGKLNFISTKYTIQKIALRNVGLKSVPSIDKRSPYLNP